MPLQKCSSEGKSGWRWGNSGHCYTGKDAKKKAIKQGIAIEGPKKFAAEAAVSTDEDIINEWHEYRLSLPAEYRYNLAEIKGSGIP